MLVAATLAPAAHAVTGTNLHQTPPIAWNDQSFQGSADDCKDADLDAGQVLWHFVLVQTDADSGTLSATFDTAGAVSTPSYKNTGGVLHFAVITGHDTLLGASTDAVGGLLNLSHICGGPEEQPSESPSEEPSESASEEPSESASEEPSESPSEEASESPSESPSEEASENPSGSELPAEGSQPPSGGVEGAVGTPAVTPPSTDTLSETNTAASSDGWRIVLVGLATILMAVLLFTQPRQARRKR
jgi:hypothetical protein